MSEEILPNSVGAGQFDSAPSCKFVMTACHDPVVCAYSCDGIANPPKGAAGGLDGHKSAAWKYKLAEGEASRTELPPFAEPVITKKEAIVSESSSGGGYGDPLERDPELVCHRVREEWITMEFAAKTYGVVVDDSHEHFVPDVAATKKLREKLRAERAAKGAADAETQETVAKEA